MKAYEYNESIDQKLKQKQYSKEQNKILKFFRLNFIFRYLLKLPSSSGHMQMTLNKFFNKAGTTNVPLSSSIAIDIIHQEETIHAIIHLHSDKNQISFTIKGEVFNLIKQCKMVPLFTEFQGKTIVQEITLCDPEKLYTCVLKGNNGSETDKIYQKLKRCISHKGFNEFYKPLKRLGRGTFATVYLIQHKFTKVRRAAKVFSFEGQKIEFKGKQALENEIKTLREIDHPNLIKYDGLYETDNLIYLVTEYLSGGTLDDMMRNKLVHTGEYVSKIIKDCLSGLNYLDEKQIMHRDIKPENIIYRKEEDQWVLSDFGLAAKSNQDYLYDKCGTMGYIAPQIMDLDAQNPKKYSQECDIFSLGIIAYTLIIGCLPFRVESENFFDKKIVWDMFEKPQCSELHPQVLKFLKKMLQKSPKQRYTAKQALQSPFFTDSQVVEGLHQYHERRRQQRYEKILQIANIKN